VRDPVQFAAIRAEGPRAAGTQFLVPKANVRARASDCRRFIKNLT
jgi:hypothetical protein